MLPCGWRAGGWGTFFQGGEEEAAAAAGCGSRIRMENEGETEASSSKAEHVTPGDIGFPLPGPQALSRPRNQRA